MSLKVSGYQEGKGVVCRALEFLETKEVVAVRQVCRAWDRWIPLMSFFKHFQYEICRRKVDFIFAQMQGKEEWIPSKVFDLLNRLPELGFRLKDEDHRTILGKAMNTCLYKIASIAIRRAPPETVVMLDAWGGHSLLTSLSGISPEGLFFAMIDRLSSETLLHARDGQGHTILERAVWWNKDGQAVHVLDRLPPAEALSVDMFIGPTDFPNRCSLLLLAFYRSLRGTALAMVEKIKQIDARALQILDEDGQTPLMLAQERGWDEVVRAIQESGVA